MQKRSQGFPPHLDVGDAVLQELPGRHLEPFLLIETDGVDLRLQVKAFGTHISDSIRYPLMEYPTAEPRAPYGGRGDDPSDLDGAGLSGLGVEPQVSHHPPLIVPVEEVHGGIVPPVRLGAGAVLLDDEDGFPQAEDLIEFPGGEFVESLYMEFACSHLAREGSPGWPPGETARTAK